MSWPHRQKICPPPDTGVGKSGNLLHFSNDDKDSSVWYIVPFPKPCLRNEYSYDPTFSITPLGCIVCPCMHSSSGLDWSYFVTVLICFELCDGFLRLFFFLKVLLQNGHAMINFGPAATVFHFFFLQVNEVK